MKRVIKTTLLILFCFVLITQLETIYSHLVKAYGNSIDYLANNTMDSNLILGY
ncbi:MULTISPECIES: hypothetical protein [Hanstruepera]|uniref:hypothetical protein n=1 Tax=Hanstruepera TaxID=1707752 RepID=UPI001CA627E2|nr:MULTISPECIES: hypothetical protein [Hanstruepera]